MSKAKVNITGDHKPLPLRVRVFSKWVSIKLRTKGITVHNIISQIRNGAILVNLAEVLTENTKHETWTRNPTKPFQYIENIELALSLFKNHGVKFHYHIVNPQEISSGNIKSINSLIWSLVMKYTIEPIVFTKNENEAISNQNSNSQANDDQKTDSTCNQPNNNEDQNNSDKDYADNNENSKNADNENNKNDDNENNNKNGDNENNKDENKENANNDINEGNNDNTNDKEDKEIKENKNKDNIETQKLFKNKKHLALLLLLKWCTDNTNDYEGIENCRPVHLALAALLNNFRPDVINYKKNFNKNDRSIAISIVKAMKVLKIPILIESEDLLNPIDDRSFFTQVALIKEVLQPQSDTSIDDVFELKKQLLSFENGDSSSNIGKSASYCSLNAYNEYDDDDDENDEKSRELINLQNASNLTNYSSGAFSSGSGADNFSFSNYEKPASHRPFMLLMTMDDNGHNSRIGKILAMTVLEEHLLNPAGYRIDLATPNPSDPAQQFTFGEGEWITVIDSVKKPGMVWDVANADSTDPPEGTPFYLFPFHGQHNQRFTYEQGRILATQNMQAVTFVGNQFPFVMKKVCESSSSLQIFKLQYL
ncbi:hypothetical protein M9Y10_015072 [Tritrichomonas musculus]|uniref:Calponin-homology (CH) domain-containing protein n=1 Tax=Tritrichomonas musculus TaxID=1915356 RepID=A0ABR2L215_9EUKA